MVSMTFKHEVIGGQSMLTDIHFRAGRELTQEESTKLCTTNFTGLLAFRITSTASSCVALLISMSFTCHIKKLHIKYIYIYLHICIYICVWVYINSRRSITPQHIKCNPKPLGVVQSLYLTCKLPSSGMY